MRRRGRHKRRKIAEMNVVPYIDVMLVLLIIFMVTTPLLSQGVKVNLPRAAAKVLPDQKVPIIVSVNQSGQYYLNIDKSTTTPLALLQIKQEVSAALSKSQDRKVFVRADQAVDYGKVVAAMVTLQQAGALTIGLMTDAPHPHP